jgi:hypothetical protein
MNKAAIYSFILLTSFGINSCKKDPFSPNLNVCESFPYYRMSYGGISHYPVNQTMPSIGTYYQDDLFYVETTDRTNRLIKLNLSTGDTVIIYSNRIILSKPRINRIGEIALVDQGFNLTILSPDNFSARTISYDSPIKYPVWRDDTSLFVDLSKNLGWPFHLTLVSTKGAILDTLESNGFKSGEYEPEVGWFYVDYDEPSDIFHFDGFKRKKIVDQKYNGGFRVIEDLVWDRKRKLLYYSIRGSGIYSFDLRKNKSKQIVRGCETRAYKNITLTNDGLYLIASRVDSYDYENDYGRRLEREELFRVNLSTRQVEDLKVP